MFVCSVAYPCVSATWPRAAQVLCLDVASLTTLLFRESDFIATQSFSPLQVIQDWHHLHSNSEAWKQEQVGGWIGYSAPQACHAIQNDHGWSATDPVSQCPFPIPLNSLPFKNLSVPRQILPQSSGVENSQGLTPSASRKLSWGSSLSHSVQHLVYSWEFKNKYARKQAGQSTKTAEWAEMIA